MSLLTAIVEYAFDIITNTVAWPYRAYYGSFVDQKVEIIMAI